MNSGGSADAARLRGVVPVLSSGRMKSCCRRRVKHGVDSNDDARDEIHGVECVSTDVSQELETVSLAFSTVDQVLKPR